MSRSDDRVHPPTNGHRPPLSDPDDATGLDDPTDLGAGRPTIHVAPPASRPLPTVSTGQLAAGFGILVALALLVIGRRRGRRG
jgi:hypothetical protein